MKTKWSIKTDGGEVLHSTEFMGCKIEVMNYPGTRTLIGVIYNLKNHVWYTIDRDKLECHVKDLKKECLEWVEERLALNNNQE